MALCWVSGVFRIQLDVITYVVGISVQHAVAHYMLWRLLPGAGLSHMRGEQLPTFEVCAFALA